MTQTIDAVRLLLHEVPHGQDLTAEQRAGERCVWCKEPASPGPGFIDLGGISARYRPHACAPCHILHTALLRTYFEWLAHTEGCLLCAELRPCPTTDRLRREHADARRACVGEGGDVRLVCFECRGPVSLDHPALPVVWLGEAGAPHLLFVHAGRCPEGGVDVHG